jgi:probable phosphoglycerate mutase
MHLLLIRHGETAHNAGRIALGRQDVPLNERGLAGAEAIARAYGNGAHDISAIYSSPLQRARDTAAPLAARVGLNVQVEADLIEMDIGELEELSFPEVRERYPAFIEGWTSESVGDARMPGGETLAEVQGRAWRAIESIRDRHLEDTVAVVTHNFVILTVLCRILHIPLGGFRRLRQDTAAVSLLELAPDRNTTIRLNDTCHLEEPVRS